jgi:sulfite oxidase
VVLSDRESDSHWQRRDYRGFPPNIDWDNVDWDSMPSIQEMPVISAIAVAQREGAEVVVRGYAWSGGGRKVIRVDLTTDEGAHWTQAKLRPKPAAPHGRDYAWTLWEGRVKVEEGRENVTVAARATDDSYNTQPERVENLWNMRGVLNNAWSRKSVDLRGKD